MSSKSLKQSVGKNKNKKIIKKLKKKWWKKKWGKKQLGYKKSKKLKKNGGETSSRSLLS